MRHTSLRLPFLLRFAGIVVLLLASTACSIRLQSASSRGAEAHASLTAVHIAEIQEAQLALSQSPNPQVREFAEHMVREHHPLLQQEQQLAAQLGFRARLDRDEEALPGVGAELEVSQETRALLAAFPTSRMLVEDHVHAMMELAKERDAAFDRAYIERQIAAHRQALALAARFEERVPSRQKALLVQEKAAIQLHLQHAQRVRAAL